MPDTSRISRAEAARILGVSLETLGRYAREGLLTRHRNKITRSVQYERGEVENLRREREGER